MSEGMLTYDGAAHEETTDNGTDGIASVDQANSVGIFFLEGVVLLAW